MDKTDLIMDYLIQKYQPTAIILYGSFADGSQNKNSDFDALLIAGGQRIHDCSVIEGTVLDVFIYPSETFQQKYDPEGFIQIFDGNIVLDKEGVAKDLQNAVRQYLENMPVKTAEEIGQEISWCKKMMARTKREDSEGYYRWHWLLVDSLEIYFDIIRKPYHGPKKALRTMEENDPEGFRRYTGALTDFTHSTLSTWMEHLERLSASLLIAKDGENISLANGDPLDSI